VAAASATRGGRPLLHAASVSATCGGLCYMWRPCLLPMVAVSATCDACVCYLAAAAATFGVRVCYLWRRRLLGAAAAASSRGGGGCYKPGTAVLQGGR
jgi:hypothetical protein